MFGLFSGGAKAREKPLHSHITLSAWLLGREQQARLPFARLETLLYLTGWKLAQSNVRFHINVAWRHNGTLVACQGLYSQLQNQSQFAIKGATQPSKSTINLSRTVKSGIKPEHEALLVDYHRFISGQSTSQLQRLCVDTYPCKTTQTGENFTLSERAISYLDSKKRHQNA